MSTQAKAARQIKKELKQAFPGVKFSVTSDSFAGGDAVRIKYEDGPTTDQVKEIAGKYQYGHFDGMTDMYEYSNNLDDIPQVKYVQWERRPSDDVRDELRAQICTEFGIDEDVNDWEFLDQLGGVTLSQKMHRVFRTLDFTAPDETVKQQYAEAI